MRDQQEKTRKKYRLRKNETVNNTTETAESFGRISEREDKLFMFIQPLKKHFGLSYCLCSFLINLAKKEPDEVEQIVYVMDTKYESNTIFKSFCSIGKEDHDGRSDGYHKLIIGNLTYHFDYIDSPRLKVLNEKTFLILNLMTTKKHPLLNAIQQYQFKSVWIDRGHSELMKEMLNEEYSCLCTTTRAEDWSFDENWDLIEENEWVMKWDR